MPATSMSVTTTAAAGAVFAAPAAVDGANGNSFPNSGREWIEVVNGAGAPITATIVTTGTYNVGAIQYAIADLAVSITNGTTKICGPFDTGLFSSTVTITWSSATTITARVGSLGTA